MLLCDRFGTDDVAHLVPLCDVEHRLEEKVVSLRDILLYVGGHSKGQYSLNKDCGWTLLPDKREDDDSKPEL